MPLERELALKGRLTCTLCHIPTTTLGGLRPCVDQNVFLTRQVDQYYYGANNTIQNAGVQYILDTVIPNLVDNPNRKFVYVEQAFYQRWWAEQDHEMKETVRCAKATFVIRSLRQKACAKWSIRIYQWRLVYA